MRAISGAYTFMLVLCLFSLQTGAITMANTCPQIAVKDNEVKEGKTKGENLKVSVISQNRAESLLKEIQAYRDIPYKYVIDGCDVRAYLAAKRIYDKYDIKSFRINAESYPAFFVDTPYTTEGMVDFSRHSVMALCVYQESQKVVQPMIVDVSFFDGLVTPDEWLKGIVDDEFGEPKVEVTETSMYKLDPHSFKLFPGFSHSDLACANEVRERFMVEQLRIEKGDLPYGIGRSKEVIRLNLCQ